MKSKRLSIVWSRCHLPEDLWPEILSRLPVKSLLRFRCVSKSWLSLINDPYFCRLHLNKFKNNRDETHLLAVEGKQQQCVVRCSDNFRTHETTLQSLGEKDDEGSWDVLSSIDGLILLRRCIWDLSRLHDLMAWNPSIRKLHKLPSLTEIEIPDSLFLDGDVDVGLGYDPLIKDYKHVKLIFLKPSILHSVAVYTLGPDSWKTIQFQGKGFSDWHWDPDVVYMKKTVYLRGCLYFIATKQETDVAELVSVDLSSEEFSYTSLPDNAYINFPFSPGVLTLVDGGCSLAVFDFEGDLCMWVLEDDSMFWTKRYTFNLKVPEFLYLKKNGDMLILFCSEEMSFRLATGKKLVQWWDLVLSYNLETEKEKIMLQRKQRHTYCEIHHVCAYIESLIFLK